MSLDVSLDGLHEHISPKNIINLDEILEKKVCDITFKETISLIFHTVQTLATNTDDDNGKWNALYAEFQIQFDKQIADKWPQMVIIKNYSHKCAYILLNEKSFIKSKNLLTLLFRILFIENHKLINIPCHYNFYKILTHELANNDDRFVKNLSLFEIFVLLRDHLDYYSRIYQNKVHLEHHLVKGILKQLAPN